MNLKQLKQLLYVSVPLHDGSLSDVEKQIVMREFQKNSDASNNAVLYCAWKIEQAIPLLRHCYAMPGRAWWNPGDNSICV